MHKIYDTSQISDTLSIIYFETKSIKCW